MKNSYASEQFNSQIEDMHTLSTGEFQRDFMAVFSTFKERVNKYRRSGQNSSRWADFCLKDLEKPETDAHNRMPMVWLLGHALHVTTLEAGELARLEDMHENAVDNTTPTSGNAVDENKHTGENQGVGSARQTSRKSQRGGAKPTTEAIDEFSWSLQNDPLASSLQSYIAYRQRKEEGPSQDERLRSLRGVASDPEEDDASRAEARREIKRILGISS